jgi:predicted metalloprotease with PDZ domain
LDVKITVVSVNPARVRVEGRRGEGSTAWSFRNIYGSASGLAERIENLTLSDESGAPVDARKLAPGEFTAARDATRFAYDLKLDPPAFVSDTAHVSWLAADHGVLMLGDILPLPSSGASVELNLPAGWRVSSVEASRSEGKFDVTDAERTVFLVGRDVTERRARVGALTFTLAAAGEWAFNESEAVDSATDILKIYAAMMGGVPAEHAQLVLLPLPQAAGNIWNAETRGSTVVLASGRLPSRLAALAQLNGSLSHELFHLWVPNGLALEGEYDWFYEGFTNYQALRTGMTRGQLTFADFLNAIGQEFDNYKATRGTKETSLVEASKRRWSNSAALVYHKGMLVALLYDLTLMRQSAGRSSLADVYRELFARYGRGGKSEDGNRAVVELLARKQGMREFVEKYIEGESDITLAPLIEPFGLRIEPGGARTHVGVADSLERPQRELLRKLGYNERSDAEARKLHEKLKRRPPQ